MKHLKRFEDVYHDLDSIYRSYKINKEEPKVETPAQSIIELTPVQKPEIKKPDSTKTPIKINVLAAMEKSGVKEIIFNWNGGVYKWNSIEGITDPSKNKITNPVLIQHIQDNMDKIQFLKLT